MKDARISIATLGIIIILATIAFAQLTPSPSPSGSPTPSISPTSVPTSTPTSEPTSTPTTTPTQTPTSPPPTSTPTTTPTSTPTATPTPTTACTESFYSDPMQTVQVVYADDPEVSSDLVVVGNIATVKQTLPMIKNKPTVFTGLGPGNSGRIHEIKAKISAGPAGLEGKFEIEIPGAEPSKYESKKKYSLKPCESREFILNPKDEEGGIIVSSIPFAHKKVKKDVEWTPLKTFEFKQTGPKEITLKFAGHTLTKVIVEKVIETVPLRIHWVPLGFDKDKKNDLKKLIDEAAARASGDSALFIQANYPVENPKFKATSAQGATTFEDLSLTQWQAFPLDGRLQILINMATGAGLWLNRINYDRQIFVVHEGFLPLGRGGQANTAGDKVVYVAEKVSPIVEAHEIGHTKPWLFDHDEELASGYLSTLLNFGREPQRPLAHDPANLGFMARGGAFDTRIVRKTHYRDNFIPAFDIANARLDPAIWLFRGVLEVSDTDFITVSDIKPMPIYQLDNIPDENETCTVSLCVPLFVNMTLQDDSIVQNTLAIGTGGIFEEFTGKIPFNQSPIVHSFEVPSQGVKKITIEDSDGIVHFSLDVTANSPVLDILSVIPGHKQIVVTVNGSDVDGGSLFASLFIEDSAGVVDAVALDRPVIGMTDFVIDTEFFEKGDYNLTVMLTDGFNTAEKNTSFSV